MKIEVSLAPDLYPKRTLREGHATVAVDVLRATTAICAAFASGCSLIVPLDTLQGMDGYRAEGYKLAAERGGKLVDIPMPDGSLAPADYGNSPSEFAQADMRGVRLAYSTTNGTVSLLRAADAAATFAGSFVNISALSARLRREGRDVVVLCSGWEGDYCIEDTLVAGALIESLFDVAVPHGDAASMACTLWQAAKDNPYLFVQRCTHVQRLLRLGAEDDVRFAFQTDICPVVPVLCNGILTL